MNRYFSYIEGQSLPFNLEANKDEIFRELLRSIFLIFSPEEVNEDLKVL